MFCIRHHGNRKRNRLLNGISRGEHHGQCRGISRRGKPRVNAAHGGNHPREQRKDGFSAPRPQQNANRNQKDGKHAHENQHALANANADLHCGRGRILRGKTEALKDTLKYGDHADYQNCDDNRKHHNQYTWIQNCVFNGRFDLRFPLIVICERGHYLVKLARPLPNARHGKQI
ncbi:hypothetical protein SDC9_62747 [bioreactor metagenome]|uniref:Uncharacterized protein n=1 Tax=bioreactor metagenome TaxID=1076179 RepID=A0A644XKT5_9ZZZZ